MSLRKSLSKSRPFPRIRRARRPKGRQRKIPIETRPSPAVRVQLFGWRCPVISPERNACQSMKLGHPSATRAGLDESVCLSGVAQPFPEKQDGHYNDGG